MRTLPALRLHAVAALSVAASFALAACAPAAPARAPEPAGQSFPQAVAMMCDVDRLAKIDGGGDELLGLGRKRIDWIEAHVDNPDAIELRTVMSVKAPAEQAEMLRRQAKASGIGQCAFADAMEKDGLGALAP